MPPRRSCFCSGRSPPGCRPWGFNATTAFLLRIQPRTLIRYVRCFNATTAFLLPVRSGPLPAGRDLVSMPPRRSCFLGILESYRLLWIEFQCHHGVPASWAGLGSRGGSPPFQCHHGVPASRIRAARLLLVREVSMPPRRSCFKQKNVLSLLERFRFNATTAFLLRPAGEAGRNLEKVSMPPRRSCF